LRRFMPDALSRLELYGQGRPLFELHHVEEEIQKALDRKVSLKSGGYVIIDQTESMTTVTSIPAPSSATGTWRKPSPDQPRSRVTIARQLRLRNLGGIIIIDFIDMEEPNTANRSSRRWRGRWATIT